LPTLRIINVYLVYGSNTARRYHFLTYGINFNTIITKELHEPQLYQTSSHLYQTSILLYQTVFDPTGGHFRLHRGSFSTPQEVIFDPTGGHFRPHRGAFSTPPGVISDPTGGHFRPHRRSFSTPQGVIKLVGEGEGRRMSGA